VEVQEGNEGVERGWGGLWRYIKRGVGVCRFGVWCMERGIGWLSGAVERRRGAQGGALVSQVQRGGAATQYFSVE
jgi:hypothetical protein